MKSIYIRNILWCIYCVYAAGVSASHRVLAWWGQCLSPSPSMLTPYSLTHKHNNMEGVRSGARNRAKSSLGIAHFSFNFSVLNLFTNDAFPTDRSSALDTGFSHARTEKGLE